MDIPDLSEVPALDVADLPDFGANGPPTLQTDNVKEESNLTSTGSQHQGSQKEMEDMQGSILHGLDMEVDLDELFGDMDDMDDIEQIDGQQIDEYQILHVPETTQGQQHHIQFRTPPSSSPQTPHPNQAPLPFSQPSTPQNFLDTSMVMENVLTVKQSIISNHLLLVRLQNLQHAYRSLHGMLVKERSLREQSVKMISQLQQQLQRKSRETGSTNSAILQAQLTHMTRELTKEKTLRLTAERSVTQYQNEVARLKLVTEKASQDAEKAAKDAKTKCESLQKDMDRHRMSVVNLMSENKQLQARLNKIAPMPSSASESEEMKREMEQLRSRVLQLEAINIRLKAGKSSLLKNDAHFNISSSLRSGPRNPPTTPPAAAPTVLQIQANTSPGQQIAQPSGRYYGEDDDVVFIGECSSQRPSPQAHPTQPGSSTSPLNSSTTSPILNNSPRIFNMDRRVQTAENGADDDVVITGETNNGQAVGPGQGAVQFQQNKSRSPTTSNPPSPPVLAA